MGQKRQKSQRESLPSSNVVQPMLLPLEEEELTDFLKLEKVLNDASRILDGVVGAAEAKELILVLLFLKFLSDLFDPSSIGSKPVTFSPQTRWEVIRDYPADGTLGQFFISFVQETVRLNQRLEGILGLKDFEAYRNEQPIESDLLLKRLIEVISSYRFTSAVSHTDLWRDIYTYLLRRFPEQYQNKNDLFTTPKDVIRLMIKMVIPDPQQDFYDPACGSGGFASLVHWLSGAQTKHEVMPRVVGQDQPSLATTVTRMDLFLSDSAEFHTGDGLRNPILTETGELQRFRYVFANPPWNQSGYDGSFYENDPLRRFPYGVPPRRSADWGWVQHILASLKENEGQAAVLLDLGMLSRGSGRKSLEKEREIRKRFIEQDVIEAIVSLPGKLFTSTEAPSCLLLINLNKPSEQRGQILLIDALHYFMDQRVVPPKSPIRQDHSPLSDEQINIIFDTYQRWTSQDNLCRVVSQEEFRSLDYELSPIQLVIKKDAGQSRQLAAIEDDLVIIRQSRTQIDAEFMQSISWSGLRGEERDIAVLLRDNGELLKGRLLDETTYRWLSDAAQERKKELALEQEYRRVVSSQLFTSGTRNEQAVSTEAGRIPRDWAVVKLGDYAKVQSGFAFSRMAGESSGKWIPWVKAGDLEQEYVLYAAGAIPETAVKDGGARRVIRPVGTLLVALYGGPSTVGKTAILGLPAVTNQSVCCIQPRTEMFDVNYLFCYFTYIQRTWMRYAVGSRLNIRLQTVQERLVPHPPLDQQQEIVTALRAINTRLVQLKQEMLVLESLLKPSSII